MDTMTAQAVRRYIGRRIAYARDLAGQSQAEFARELSAYLNDAELTREQVANIETARKRVDVALLCAIAHVQDRPVAWYFADAPSAISGAIPGYLSRHDQPTVVQFPPRPQMTRSVTDVPLSDAA